MSDRPGPKFENSTLAPIENKPRRAFPEGRVSGIRKKYRAQIGDLKQTITESGGDPNKFKIDYYLRKTRGTVRNEIISEDAVAETVKLKGELTEAVGAATKDALTGLPNYRGFSDQLRQVIERGRINGEKSTIVLLDLNGLKKINDGPGGHEAGNQYIKKVAEILSTEKRGTDTLARMSDVPDEELQAREADENEPFATRWGGDEFAVIFEGTDYEGVKTWFGRKSPELQRNGISFGAGAAEVETTHIKNDQDVLDEMKFVQKLADWALYEAKDESKRLNSQDNSNSNCVLFLPDDIFSEHASSREAIVSH